MSPERVKTPEEERLIKHTTSEIGREITVAVGKRGKFILQDETIEGLVMESSPHGYTVLTDKTELAYIPRENVKYVLVKASRSREEYIEWAERFRELAKEKEAVKAEKIGKGIEFG